MHNINVVKVIIKSSGELHFVPSTHFLTIQEIFDKTTFKQ